MEKETKKINGNDVIVTWSDWQRAGDGERQRYILDITINGWEWDLRSGDYERFAAGQVKNKDNTIIGIYLDGEPMEEGLDPIAKTFNDIVLEEQGRDISKRR
jgi:hypothetical protein